MKTFAKHCSTIGIGFLVGVGLLSAQEKPNTLTPSETKEGWKLLFNGKSLAGWQPRTTSAPPATGDWTVADEAISCPGTSPGWLATDDTFSNFKLKLQFKGSEKVNSGVFLRSQKEGQPHKTGYELQIWDYQPAGYNTGSLVESLKASPTKIIPDEWNTYDIVAKGGHYTVVLNGKTVLDGDDAKHTSGVIGLQCQKGNQIEFRNIKLLPLDQSR
jgi:3-keto-disaccharide hydrolase